MPAIEVRGLTKRFGDITAVDDLSFTVGAGTVTGFLGPNGAGKTTTLRMLLGLIRPDAGTAFINGRPYREVRDQVGASLEATGFHPGRTARAHLRTRAMARGLDEAGIDAVLAMVDLAGDANRNDSSGRRQHAFCRRSRAYRCVPESKARTSARSPFAHGDPDIQSGAIEIAGNDSAGSVG